MEPITLSVDLDGTLADFMTPALQTVNAHFGTAYSLRHVVHSDARNFLPTHHHDHFLKFVRDPEVYAHLPALPEGIAAVLALSALDCDIVITSHRPPAALLPTRNWLTHHGIPYSHLTVAYDSKILLADAYGPERPLIFIDDDPSLPLSLALPRDGIEVWLLRTSYTGIPEPSNCRIFASWSDLQSALLDRLTPAVGF